MLMMRLQRIGRRNEAHFKIVVIEKTKGPKSQKYVDIIGSYNPKLGRVQIDAAKTTEWLAKGVQPSDTVRNFLIDQGVLEGRKINVLPKKSPVVDEEKIAREKAEAEAKIKAEADAKAKAEADAKAEEEAKAEADAKAEAEAQTAAQTADASVEETPAEIVEEAPVAETVSETVDEVSTEEAPSEETPVA